MEDDRSDKEDPKVTVTHHPSESRVIPHVLYDEGRVVPFPKAEIAKVNEAEPSLLKNFYIRMAISRFQNTLAAASQAQPGSIPTEDLEFLKDLGHVLDYVAKLELQVVELREKSEAQPAEPSEGQDG